MLPVMKKPAQKERGAPRSLQPTQLQRIRGGITATDDWETPVSNKVWQDDWLAPV